MRSLRPALLAFAVLAGGCGKKMDPLPPLQAIPARVEPLRLSQEGSDVVLRFPYPSRTAQGEPLTGLTHVTVWREILPAGPDARPPMMSKEPAIREREEKSFLAHAEKIRDLTRGDLDDATLGPDVLVRDSLFSLYREKRLGRLFLRYGVVATRGRKLKSPLSPVETILPRVPPDRPQELRAVAEEKRVCLEWRPPLIMLDGSKPVQVAGYAVYRREASEDEYDQPIGTTTLGEFYVDETIRPDRVYLYTVRAAPTAELPLVLGPPADEVRVSTKDVFPPPPPEGVLVLAEEGGNRIVWNPVLASDLAGYRVYRRDAPGGTWRKIADDLKDPLFFDPGAPQGARYRVTAFDQAGNESAPGSEKPEGAEKP